MIPSHIHPTATLISGVGFGGSRRILSKNVLERSGLTEEHVWQVCKESRSMREKMKYAKLLLKVGYTSAEIIRRVETMRQRDGGKIVERREMEEGEQEMLGVMEQTIMGKEE